MSPSASIHSTDKPVADEPTKTAENLNDYDEAEENYQPKSLKFWAIMIGMYLSIFLVALVSIPSYDLQLMYFHANNPTGQDNHCCRYSRYHQ